ncbi:MAG: MCE family protein [Bacteroides sp.]|nr:MCE family protein [Bacteroides sp.]MBD5333125.1 MCE family protein [Bacteroides sp.]
MSKLSSREVKIGASVLIALIALVFGINYLKGVNIFKAANYYYASYTDVTGLAQSAPVTLNGYKVGLVREVAYEYDNPGHVRVELSLDRKLRLPVGTKAEIVTDMLGTSTIQLIMGTSQDMIEVGSKITGIEGSGLMDKVSTELMPTVMQIAPGIDSLVKSLNVIAGDPALLNSVRHLDAVMANLESTTTRLNSAMTAVPAIVTNANATMANVKEISANLTQLSGVLAKLSDDLKDMPLDSTMRSINNIAVNLDRATEQLNSTNSSLGLLLNDPALYNNINNTAAHLDSIMIDLKKQPKRYIPSIKVF